MNHKRTGMPSKGWLIAYLRRYENQRVCFELAPESGWHNLLVEQGAFTKDEPIYVSAVYFGVMKRPKGWPDLYARGPMQLFLRFSKVVFRQGNVTTRSFMSRTHYQHKNETTEFELSEMRGVELAERLKAMTPRLGHNPGRLNCSEGSSGTGFPYKQELALPPRGSDSFDVDRSEEA
jgi:hypothetical protein